MARTIDQPPRRLIDIPTPEVECRPSKAAPSGAGLLYCTVIGLATRGIMMIESCRVIEPTENQIPVGWNG